MSNEFEQQKPPIVWYSGIAFPEEGIRMIYVGSASFYALHWDLYDKMWAWGHSQLLPGQTEYKLSDMAQAHKDTGIFVKKVTGFTPEALMSYKDELKKIYVGQTMGPFPFPVDWIEK